MVIYLVHWLCSVHVFAVRVRTRSSSRSNVPADHRRPLLQPCMFVQVRDRCHDPVLWQHNRPDAEQLGSPTRRALRMMQRKSLRPVELKTCSKRAHAGPDARIKRVRDRKSRCWNERCTAVASLSAASCPGNRSKIVRSSGAGAKRHLKAGVERNIQAATQRISQRNIVTISSS